MTVPLRARWRDGGVTLGGWLAIPSPVSAEAVARAGFDAAIEPYGDLYRVVAGPFAEEAAARSAAGSLGGFLRRC